MPQLNRSFYPLWPDYIKFGVIEYPPGGELGPRIQHTYELVFIHRGELHLQVDDQSYQIGNKTSTLLFPGHTEHFQFSTHEKSKHSYLHLSFPFMPKSLVEELYNLPKTLPLSDEMDEYIKNLSKIKACEFSTKIMLMKTHALAIFWLFLAEAESIGPQESPGKSIVEDACRYIISSLNEDICLSNIARAVNTSPEYLIRVFNSEIGITPMRYVWKRRVSRGIDLLVHSGLSVGEISNRCGFKTQNHFSRRIYEETNHTPRELRKSKWN